MPRNGRITVHVNMHVVYVSRRYDDDNVNVNENTPTDNILLL